MELTSDMMLAAVCLDELLETLSVLSRVHCVVPGESYTAFWAIVKFLLDFKTRCGPGQNFDFALVISVPSTWIL